MKLLVIPLSVDKLQQLTEVEEVEKGFTFISRVLRKDDMFSTSHGFCQDFPHTFFLVIEGDHSDGANA